MSDPSARPYEGKSASEAPTGARSGSERPMFATVGRSPRRAEDVRSRTLLLFVVLGLCGAAVALFWEQGQRTRLRFVEVSYVPAAAVDGVGAETEGSGP